MTAQNNVPDTGSQRNIAAYLPLISKTHGSQLGVVFPHGRDASGRVSYTHYTFAQLDRQSNQIAAGLMRYGITKGTRCVLMVKPSLDFFALTFALFKVGAVPVMIDPGMGLKNLKQCLGEAQPEAFIGIPKAHIARVILRWPAGEKRVTVGKKLGWGGITLDDLLALGVGQDFEMPQTNDEDLAAILFTSGSTGVPKGAIYTHGIFQAQIRNLREIYDIRFGEIDLATFPLFALFAPALGMTAIIPDMDATRPAQVDPIKIQEAIENFGVTNMFGSPALLNTVGRWGAERGVTFPSLKRVISAGAPVPAAVMETIHTMLNDEAQIFTPYGATESLPVASIGSREILDQTAAMTAQGKGVCVGRPVREINLSILPINDEPIEHMSQVADLPQGQIGEITVKGPMVTRAYFNRDSSTQLAKIQDDDGFWHRMGDLGYLDEQGRVWFCGRKAHRVRTAQGDMYTIPSEGIFNQHPKVFRTALVGIGTPGQHEPVLCVELESHVDKNDGPGVLNDLAALAEKSDITRPIKRMFIHPAFPVDIRHNAKIFREKLAVWVTSQL